MTTRRAYAAFSTVVIIGCMLMLAVKALTVEFGISGALRSEALEEFEKLLYRYENFWDEPYAESPVCTEPAYQRIPGVISKEDAAYDVDFLFRVLKYGYAGYGFFGGDEVFLAARQGYVP